MRVTYVGHATVLIEDSGSAIVTDPLLRRRVGHLRRQGELPAALPQLDGVLISHLHRDHLDTPSLKRIADGTPAVVPASGVSAMRRTRLQPVPVEEGGELRLGAFRVLAVPADHPTRRTPLGQETDALGYVLTAPGGSVYFAGDTDLFDGMRAIGDLGLDVALLPVAGWGPTLGPGHMDARAAAEAAALLRPRIAIPIHWGTVSPVGMAGSGDTPARAFAAHAAELAPGVGVVQLAPGKSLDL
jgi:L-ascorbate metabolism protein UlaG (beta-lactamase superfamily)